MEQPQEVTRVRLPRGKEVIGTVIEMLGASRFRVDCRDKNERICRIPGKLKRRLWIKSGNIVIVVPWDIDMKERGDIIWRYTPAQADWLMKKGYV